MNCWHCEKELEFSYASSDFTVKVYTCADCDTWYEIRKEKTKLNAAVPVMMSEIDAPLEAVPKAA